MSDEHKRVTKWINILDELTSFLEIWCYVLHEAKLMGFYTLCLHLKYQIISKIFYDASNIVLNTG